jgi:glycosyltransferase involved in cell wall biosynthesis
MRVLHLVAGELTGGAARGAYWLHLALREIGVDSEILTNGRSKSNDPSVIRLHRGLPQQVKSFFSYRLTDLLLHLYPTRHRVIFSTGFHGTNFTKHPAYSNADIIHLHWINELVSMRALHKVKKPLVWTMRDMWPFTGGCHVGAAFNCDRYRFGCGQCPQLRSRSTWDLTRVVIANKRAALPRHLHAIGISQWLTQCARDSSVFKGLSVETISNNIDTRQFSPVDKAVARDALGLPRQGNLILVGAENISHYHKGFDLFILSLRALRRQDISLLLFGESSTLELSAISVTSTHLGFLSDTISLRLAYSAADVFVAPSRTDAFGKTLAEAMACGTPVVCFDATGPRDIVEHKATGYRARPFDPEDLANGIQWVLERSPEEQTRLRRAARTRAVTHFDSRVIAEQYHFLYQRLVGGDPAVRE